MVLCDGVEPGYPEAAPFHPGELYPEYEHGETSQEANAVYAAVRSCFARAGLDAKRIDTPHWNPLGDLIGPGETVVLKPNLVKEAHPTDPEGWRYVLTHGSVIRAVADYVFKARAGRVVVADAPQTDSSFDRIVTVLGLDVLRDFYAHSGLELELVDLRPEQWENRGGVIVGRRALPGDPAGVVAFDLGASSEFVGHGGQGSYYGAFYDAGQVNRHHSDGRHEYLLSRTAIEADVIFSLPKLKTHKKAGITVTLKNLVGLNGDKNWLPHHTEGSPRNGGDGSPDFPLARRLERAAAAAFRRSVIRMPRLGPWLMRQARPVGLSLFGDTEDVIRSGNWWGNDTIWRMCLDLNKIISYGEPDGTMRSGPQARKRHLSLVDGVIAGSGSGPINPDPVAAGLVVFGLNPVSVDAACACLLGFDPDRIPTIAHSFRCESFPLAEWGWRDVRVMTTSTAASVALADLDRQMTPRFTPHFGWQGHIERDGESTTTHAGALG